jgi:hypothetical protein
LNWELQRTRLTSREPAGQAITHLMYLAPAKDTHLKAPRFSA